MLRRVAISLLLVVGILGQELVEERLGGPGGMLTAPGIASLVQQAIGWLDGASAPDLVKSENGIIFEVSGGSFFLTAGLGQTSSSMADILTRVSSLVMLNTM